jgi:ABC-type Fe3+/spermidine/putrescine transport system ATPase subunit
VARGAAAAAAVTAPWAAAGIRVSEARLEDVGVRAGGRWVLRHLHLDLRPGELCALLGPAGAGKSTVLRLLAGFAGADEGRITIDGEDVAGVPPWRRSVGLVVSPAALWPHLTVREHLELGPRARGQRGDELRRTAEEALALLGLERLAERRPAELAADQPLRVALARALAVRPRLLLLDDVLADLDIADRTPMRAELERLHRAVGITTLCAVRDGGAALALSTRVAVLDGGALVQEGRPEDVYWRPRTRAVAELAGATSVLPVTVVELREAGVVAETAGGARVPVASGGHAWRLGARAWLCLRPEALGLEEAERARGGIPGTVERYAFEGGRASYEVAVPGGTVRVETATSPAQGRGFQRGDRVKLEIAPESSVLVPADAS